MGSDQTLVVKVDFLTEEECFELVKAIQNILREHIGCSYDVRFGNNASVSNGFN